VVIVALSTLPMCARFAAVTLSVRKRALRPINRMRPPRRDARRQKERVMDRIWLKNYPAGMPAEVNVEAFASVKEIFHRSASRFAALPAYSNMGTTISYEQLDKLSRDFGAALQHDFGLRKGDRVAIMLPNLLQYPVTMFGALRAGLTVVNVNPMYTARELEHQLKDSGASAIVVLENFAHTLQEVLERNPQMRLAVIVSAVGDMLPLVKEVVTNLVVRHVKHMVPEWQLPQSHSWHKVLHDGARHVLEELALSGDDIAFLQYTGGTTGVAKGVVLSHRNLVANVEQLSVWIARDLKDGEETAVLPLPLYHVYALTCNLAYLKIGAHVVLITNPRDLPDFIHTLKKTPVTTMIGVNTLYRALLDAPGFAELDLHRLKITSAGGMAVQRVVAERWKQRTGVPIIEGYGLTETSPVVCSNPLDIVDWTGTIGMPLPNTDIAVLDDAGAELPLGQVGEICVRGPQVMQRYWNRPDETAKVFTADGWLRTGDMGYMDERGYFRITDRKKDMIIVSGFKVFPNEVEDVVAMHPGVLESAAIGVPDDKTGEAVKLVVVRQDPALTEQAVIEHCRSKLTAYKVPKQIEFRSEPLPKSPIGKILRRELRGTASAAAAAAAPAGH
jgi:long-chain acyl-CoA synthetase